MPGTFRVKAADVVAAQALVRLHEKRGEPVPKLVSDIARAKPVVTRTQRVTVASSGRVRVRAKRKDGGASTPSKVTSQRV